jgi:hypothetical protein
MSNYFQTWPYVSKLKRLPVCGKILVRLIQAICGWRGHELSKTEWGYGGGDTADRWCRWCNKHVQVPKTEIQFAFKENASLMSNIGKEVKP